MYISHTDRTEVRGPCWLLLLSFLSDPFPTVYARVNFCTPGPQHAGVDLNTTRMDGASVILPEGHVVTIREWLN